MPQGLTTWLGAHGIAVSILPTLIAGYAMRHFRPAIKAWLLSSGPSDIVMNALQDFKPVLKKWGATDDEIREVEAIVAQIALRSGQAIQKDSSS